MAKKSDALDAFRQHADLGAAILQVVKESGLLKTRRRRASSPRKAKPAAKPAAKKKETKKAKNPLAAAKAEQPTS